MQCVAFCCIWQIYLRLQNPILKKTHITQEIGNIVIQNQYIIFHNKLLISYPLKPIEEDETSSIQSQALPAYTDIKRYILRNIFQFDSATLIVGELKKVNYPMTAEQELRALINVAKNIETVSIFIFQNPTILDNHFFPGYFVTGKVSENNGNGNGYICYGVLTNEKIIIIASGIFQNSNEIDILQKVLMSIKENI